MYKRKPKMPAQFAVIEKEHIPYAVTVSPDELSAGQVRVKPQIGKEQGSGNGILLERAELIPWLKKELGRA